MAQWSTSYLHFSWQIHISIYLEKRIHSLHDQNHNMQIRISKMPIDKYNFEHFVFSGQFIESFSSSLHITTSHSLCYPSVSIYKLLPVLRIRCERFVYYFEHQNQQNCSNKVLSVYSSLIQNQLVLCENACVYSWFVVLKVSRFLFFRIALNAIDNLFVWLL